MTHSTCTRCCCARCIIDRAMRTRQPLFVVPVLVFVGGVWVVKYVKDKIRYQKNKSRYEPL